jgi:two-component system, OmpR family, sensor kinase
MATRGSTAEHGGGWISGLRIPDEVLLRRFGYVRAVGGGAYIIAVLVLFAVLGTEVWPLLIGVPVLVVATTGYFMRSLRAPRTSVVVSLLADAVVFGGAIAYIGGTGSGLVSLYAIVIVSAGILLGPSAALVFTAFSAALSGLQLLMEELGFLPALLHRPELGDRLPILLVSLAVLASVGYLTATYASRLHELIVEAGDEARVIKDRGRRRRSFVEQAARDVHEPLRELDALAEIVEARWADLRESERQRMASRLRMAVMRLDAEVAQLADVGSLETGGEDRPEPVFLRRVAQDTLVAIGDRIERHVVQLEVPPIKVVGNRRAARRVLLALLENVVEHTPPGTQVRVSALTTAAKGVLVVTDDGPGIPPEVAEGMFTPPADGSERVGLPLVAELCEGMGAEVRHEVPSDGGTRFLVAFRLAPSGAPTADDPAEARADGDAAPDGAPTDAAAAEA